MFFAVILIFYCFGLVCSETANLTTELISNEVKTNSGSNELNVNSAKLVEKSAESVAETSTELIKQLEGTDEADVDENRTSIAKKPSNNENIAKVVEKSENVAGNSTELIKQLEDTDEADLDENNTSTAKKASNDENSNNSIVRIKVKIENLESDDDDDYDLTEEYKVSDELKIMTKSRLNNVLKNLNNKQETRTYTFEIQKDRHPKMLADFLQNLAKKMENKNNYNNPNILKHPNYNAMQNQNMLREQTYNGMQNHNTLREQTYNGMQNHNILRHPNYNGMQNYNKFRPPNPNGMQDHNIYRGQTYNGMQNPLSNLDFSELNRHQIYELITKVSNQLCSNIKEDVFEVISQNEDNLFSRQSKQLQGEIIFKLIPNLRKTFSNIARVKISIPPNASAENKDSLVCRYVMKRHHKALARPNLFTPSILSHDDPMNTKNNMDVYHYYWEKELNGDYGAHLLSNDDAQLDDFNEYD